MKPFFMEVKYSFPCKKYIGKGVKSTFGSNLVNSQMDKMNSDDTGN